MPLNIDTFVTAKGRGLILEMLSEAQLREMLATKVAERGLDQDPDSPNASEARELYPLLCERYVRTAAGDIADDLLVYIGEIERHPGALEWTEQAERELGGAYDLDQRR